MKIIKVEPMSRVDYPGKRSLVLYAHGCNMRCPFCFNSDCLSSLDPSSVISRKEVFDMIRRRLDHLDAVVFSGGEPTLNPELRSWISEVKALGLQVKLDTNGTNPEMLRELTSAGLIDYISMDIKAPLENYAQLAGRQMNVEPLRTSIWLIKHSGIEHEFRTTVIPGMHTTRELKSIAELVHGADRFVVQDFISEHALKPELRGRAAFPRKPLNDIRRYVERRVKTYEIRHSEEAIVMQTPKRRQRKLVSA